MTRPACSRARWALATSLLLLAVACDGSTGPSAGRAPLSLVFLDAGARLNVLRGGAAPVPTALTGIVPLAATTGKVAFFAPPQARVVDGQVVVDSGGLRLYSLADGHVDTLPVPNGGAGAGAISPDGQMLAYVRGGRAVHLVLVRLADNARDSVDLSAHDARPAAVQAIDATPIYSPSGDSVAFLLPNLIGLQLLIYEVRSGRVEVFPLPVPVTTLFDPTLRGWPRWTRDASIRFLVRRRTPAGPSDTLTVLRVFPREPRRPAEVAFEGRPAAGVTLNGASSYSFDATGTAVAFGMTAAGRAGSRIAVLRQGAGEFEELTVGTGSHPALPLVVP